MSDALIIIYIMGGMSLAILGIISGQFDFIFLSPLWPLFYIKYAYQKLIGK